MNLKKRREMYYMKRFIAVCLVMTLALSLATTAFAAGNGRGGGNGIGQRDRLQDGSYAICSNESCPFYPDCPRDGSCRIPDGTQTSAGKGGQQRDRLRDGSCVL
jgi:hypothetical protein